MNDISVFYSSLATVGVIIALGFVLGKAKVVTAETNKHIVNLLLVVAWPCAIFSAFPQEFSLEAWRRFLIGLGGGVVVLGLVAIVSKLIFTKKLFKTELSHESQFAFIFNNASFLGYPLVLAMFGREALMPYCGFILVFNAALFSYGIYLFERKLSRKLFKETLLNPCLIAVVLGTVFFVYSLKLPTPVNGAIGYLGAMMTPLSLICIGYMLSRAEFSKLWQHKKLFATAALQLTLGPLIAYIALTLLNVPAEIRNILVLIQALPTATSLGLFAERYGGNPVEASELVAISTVLSIITLPVMIGLLIV
ncbi:MAG: AEC family transporter [Candidatus Nomurabacteria bacterium]|nr:AEC family transporter [Candidatus Nomurabacteria bacterium]